MTDQPENSKLGTLETEGHALARAWKSKEGFERSTFTRESSFVETYDGSIKKPKGLLVRTGAIMVAIANKETTLLDSGLGNVDKRRRSECKWYFENFKPCQEFITQSKKGYGNLSALQKAMAKIAKAEQVSDDQEKASDDQEKSSDAEKSDVGRSELPVTKYELAKEIMKICENHKINPLEVVDLVLLNVEANQPKVKPMGSTQVTYDLTKTGDDGLIEGVIASA
tara:strand:- start:839 stop:1513 length:675 start_codon:yes stop_codon:yes gene_type:complete